ncbi:Uncharacterised protein [Vibrio cholerae]|nr:Uncharacterised protein [Vibrio cholerae]
MDIGQFRHIGVGVACHADHANTQALEHGKQGEDF